MKNWKIIGLMLLAGLGWMEVGMIVIGLELPAFWFGWVALLAGTLLIAMSVDKALDPKKRW